MLRAGPSTCSGQACRLLDESITSSRTKARLGWNETESAQYGQESLAEIDDSQSLA
jgi:hypothetical protein